MTALGNNLPTKDQQVTVYKSANLANCLAICQSTVGMLSIVSQSTDSLQLTTLVFGQLILHLDHVYFAHPSTNISVDISTNTRSMYWSTYRKILKRHVGMHMDRLSADIMTEICGSTYQPRYRPSQGRHIYRPTIGRYLSRYSSRRSADTLTIDCWWNIGRLSVVYQSKA